MGTSANDRWAELWDRHADDVYAYARRRVGPDDAPDVVAEVFAVAVTHPERVPDDALPWLYKTAWNIISNHWRTQARRQQPALPLAAVDDPADVVVERERLLAALAGMSDQDREALLLTAWEGLDGTRAAAATGCSPSAFAVRLHRARARLEVVLNTVDSDEPNEGVTQ